MTSALMGESARPVLVDVGIRGMRRNCEDRC